eukprot:m.332352 g.332352  ORF g.332352 m.332352 type:complete len:518 (-) comp16935_c0_seq1:166-1719(-)
MGNVASGAALHWTKKKGLKLISLDKDKDGDGLRPPEGYTFIKTIGSGSSAEVKLGKRIATGENIAIKIIQRKALDSHGLKRVGQEIAVWENLEHPGVIQLYEVIATDKVFMFVCEYAAGGDLLDYIRENGRLKGEAAKRTCAQLVCALDYCHRQGVVHRDLKLENVLLDENLNPKLADWGFGRFYSVDSSSSIKEWCGSPPYAAPEIFLGRPYVGPGIDIWSLGVVFYGICTGKLPFDADTFDRVSSKVIAGAFSVPFYMPLECEHLIRGMLCKSMSQRFRMSQIKNHAWLDVDRYGSQQGKPDLNLQVARPRPRQTQLHRPLPANRRKARAHTYYGNPATPTKKKPTDFTNDSTGTTTTSSISMTPRKKTEETPSKFDRVRPKSCVPDDARQQSHKKEEQQFYGVRRLFYFVGGRRNNGQDDEHPAELNTRQEPLTKILKSASRSSLPLKIEQENVENDRPATPKPRFPCVVCHQPGTAWWDFENRSPTKCLSCRTRNAPIAESEAQFKLPSALAT